MKAHADLHPYQRDMIDHVLATPKCALWAFMGAGKTVAVLTAIDALIFAGIVTKPVLVVAPLRVARDVWPQEVTEWEYLRNLRVVAVVGSAMERNHALELTADVYTVNYENLEWLIDRMGTQWPFGMIVLDEATKVKSLRANVRSNAAGTQWVAGQGGKRPKALLKVIRRCPPDRIVELSGTPASNGLKDLWGQVFFLDMGQRLGRVYESFTGRWFRFSFDGYNNIEPLPYAQEQIQNEVRDICVSLKSEDYFDLAEPIVRTISVQLPLTARRQYREMERTLFTEIELNQVEAYNAGAKTAKLLQFAAGSCYLGKATDPGERQWITVHDEKLDALEDIVEEANGEPLLVAYHFKSDLTRLMRRFPKARHLDQKPETLKAWNEGHIDMLLAHPASAGHGLNLQSGGSRLVYFSSSWNFEEHAQIAERIGPVRQAQSGFKRNVYIYYIIAKSTVDEDVMDALTTKRSVQDALMAGLRRRNNA